MASGKNHFSHEQNEHTVKRIISLWAIVLVIALATTAMAATLPADAVTDAAGIVDEASDQAPDPAADYEGDHRHHHRCGDHRRHRHPDQLTDEVLRDWKIDHYSDCRLHDHVTDHETDRVIDHATDRVTDLAPSDTAPSPQGELDKPSNSPITDKPKDSATTDS